MRSNLAEVVHFPDQASPDVRPNLGIILGGGETQGDWPQPDLHLITAQPQQEITPRLSLVQDVSEQPAIKNNPTSFVDSEAIPEISVERQNAAQNAARLLGQRRNMLQSGETAEVPTAVSVLGTARKLAEIKAEFGANSSQYKEVFTGLVLDCERLLAEAFSKNTSEYFAKVLQKFNKLVGEHFAHGLSVPEMTEKAIVPLADKEEEDRRVNEHVEETGTYGVIGRAIGRIGLQKVIDLVIKPSLPEDVAATGLHVTTVSTCTDTAIRDYKINPKGSHGGYAPSIEKLMIRRVHFMDDNGDRLEEQVAVPGTFITLDLINKVNAQKTAQAQNKSKTELHGTQFLGVDGEGVMSYVRELDEAASAEYGKNIFMGEEVPAGHPKDYAAFEDEAEIRRKKLAPKPTELAEYLITLEEKGTTEQVAEGLIDKFLKKTLLDVAKKHPEMAEAMFDKETANGFREVARLEALGKIEEAKQLQITVEANAPEVSYCGAGGCGLEAVARNSAEAQKAIALGLSAEGDLLHDTERACPGCSEMSVYYDDAGNKACIGCGSAEIDGVSSDGSQDS